MGTPATSNRLSARVNEKTYATIREAAALTGATVNQFLVQSTLERAQKILEHEQTIELSSRAAKVFFSAIEEPPEPNAALKKAAKRHSNTLKRD